MADTGWRFAIAYNNGLLQGIGGHFSLNRLVKSGVDPELAEAMGEGVAEGVEDVLTGGMATIYYSKPTPP